MLLDVNQLRLLLEKSYQVGNLTLEAYDLILEKDLLSNVRLEEQELPENAVIAGVLVDNSQSVNHHRNEGKIIFGHNRMIEALNGVRQQGEERWERIRLRTEYLDGTIINNWVMMAKAQTLIGDANVQEADEDIRQQVHAQHWISDGQGNYRGDGLTPLYDRTAELITSAILLQELQLKSNKHSRVGILIITDGEDENSASCSALDVRTLVEALGRRSNLTEPNVVMFLGVPGKSPEYYISIARNMGIQNEESEDYGMVKRVLTPHASLRDIRRAFLFFSSQMLR